MTALIVYATKDAMIRGITDNNYGALATFQVGGGITAWLVSGIMQFDLSSLDAGTIINSAYVSIFGATVLSHTHAQLAELPAADVGWVEGTKLGEVEVGTNCWNYHTYDTVAWSGGAGAGGGTFIANFDSPTPQGAEVQITLTVAMVQAWVGPSGINPGLIAKAQSGTQVPRAMCTRETTSSANYPRLTMDVTYPSNLKPPMVWPHYRI